MLEKSHSKAAFAVLLMAGVVLLAQWISGPASVRAQQKGGADEINARSKADIAYQAKFTWQPGGTPEDKLWQVLVLFGAGDTAETSWNGTASATGGEILQISGYRFEPPDRVLPTGGWRIQSQNVRVLESSPLAGHGATNTFDAVLPKGVFIRGSGTTGTVLTVDSGKGAIRLNPMGLKFGEWSRQLNGRVMVQRVPPATDLSGTELRQHDFPSIASGSDGALWTTWYSFHDRREELNFRRYKNGEWTRLIPVGRAAEDLWRPQVTTDAGGKPWLIWSERPHVEGPGNWDIYAMAWEDNEWGPRVALSDGPLPDIEPHVSRAPDGTIYVVWQSMQGRYMQIHLRYLRDGKWSETIPVTNSQSNNWEPAVAAGSDGKVWVVWDRYTKDYNVWTRSYSESEGLSPETKLSASPRFEAHANVAVDTMNRPWVAWETSSVNWGKGTGAFFGENEPGTSLGGTRRIEMLVLDNNAWKAPATLAPKDPLALGSTGESRPTLFAGPEGNIWLSFKRRYSRLAYRPSIYWEYFLTRLDGDHWTDPIVLPNSWTRKSTRMGLAANEGRLWAFWPNENRNWAFASRPLSNRVLAGSITLPGRGPAAALRPYQAAPATVPVVHPNEAADVRAIRNFRISADGETLRIVRGDLHRHSELSQDVGGMDDGSLPEFYRYMIDAADMDFGASTDHQAGGTDYWNALTQKMADMYYFPDRFSSLYAYERNLGNPFGHRNMVYTHRNYPIVPFYQRIDPRFMLPDTPDGELLTFNSMSFGSGIRNDTKLLYDIVKKTHGLAIPHTSGTDSMGTDWADNDPEVDAVVEIYQGARQSYETKNAPRGIKDGEEAHALGGFQEPGLVWNAWKKGYRLGVIASSDHYSTHISYAMVYTPSTDRQDIFDSIKKRHTYGATDNIIVEFRMGDHLMGDDFSSREKLPLRVRVIGTGEIETIHVIRDAAYIYKVAPGKREAEFEYVDNDAGAGDHWYYIRVEQKNSELAWSSPIWVRYE